MDLSVKALQICKENYDSRCGACPLRSVCVARVAPGKEGFYAWVESVNQKADELLS